jgi:hypothetical protein
MKLCQHDECAKVSETIYEKKDACYTKVKSRYDVWPSAYASGALVKCRKVGAKNWGNKSKKEGVTEEILKEDIQDLKKIVKELEGASKMHAGQAKRIQAHLDDMNVKEELLDENILKQIQQAEKIAKSMAGNMTGAVKGIEKIRRGLSRHKRVKVALKKYNESVNEAKYKGYDYKRQNRKDGLPLIVPALRKTFANMKDLKKYIDKHGKMESVNEADLGLTYKKGKTVKVKHKKSGKTLVIVDKPVVKKEYEKIGYYEVKPIKLKGKSGMGKISHFGMESVTENKCLCEACWKGYEKKGMKTMFGKEYPNCVKKEGIQTTTWVGLNEMYWENNIGEYGGFTFEVNEDLNEAEYQGRKVKLGKIMQGDVKKFKVYVNNPKGNVVKVNFGQGGDAKGGTMRIRKDNPGARKSFRARHNCDTPGPRHKARYWSCRKW